MKRKDIESILDTLALSQENFKIAKERYDKMEERDKEMFAELTERYKVGITSLSSFILG